MSTTQKIIAALLFVITLGIVAAVVISMNSSSETSDNTMNAEQSSLLMEHDEFLGNADVGQVVDKTNQDNVEISVEDFLFEETIMTVSAGTTVTWTNNGTARHDVVTDASSPMQGPNSELLANGETYEYTFDEPGTYYYICTPHASQMRAVVIVE